MKLELQELKGLDGIPITIDNTVTGQIVELDLDKNTKYLFMLDLGPLKLDVMTQQMRQWSKMLEALIGKDRAIIMTRSADRNPCTVYELVPADDD